VVEVEASFFVFAALGCLGSLTFDALGGASTPTTDSERALGGGAGSLVLVLPGADLLLVMPIPMRPAVLAMAPATVTFAGAVVGTTESFETIAEGAGGGPAPPSRPMAAIQTSA
jgi:hypothetical protein